MISLQQLSGRRLQLPVGLLIFSIATVLLLGSRYDGSAAFWSARPTIVNQTAILTFTPVNQESAAWTDKDGIDEPLVSLGRSAQFIQLGNDEIDDVRTGEVLADITKGEAFNLAVLKLPSGSKFQFVGVARGPTRTREYLKMIGSAVHEQVLLAMGLNITSEGVLFPVTRGQTLETLDLPSIPKKGCVPTGHFSGTYGGEDARLFWTDAGTPALTFGRFTDAIDTCRGIGFVADLRALYAPLHEAMVTSGGVSAYDGRLAAGAVIAPELRRDDRHSMVEKNWAAFYPGPSPNRSAVIPHMSYQMAPTEVLEPVTRGLRHITYATVPERSDLIYDRDCVVHHHRDWQASHIHQATPLYRLTLCARGCLATEQNTVLFAIVHAELRPRYAKFIATFSVTAPYQPLSVGPFFTVRGFDDFRKTNFALTMAPLEPHDLDRSFPPVRLPQAYLPSHFFLDDDILLTLGHDDNKMLSTVIPVIEAIGRQRMCD